MNSLELKVPPPLLAAGLAIAMWFAARLTPSLSIVVPGRPFIVGALALCALCIGLPAGAAFQRAGTTVHPMHPDKASTLVTSGVYRFSRNPMYLGVLLLLTAWAIHLGNAVALFALPVFVGWMNRYQIGPEERILRAKFGEAFVEYEHTVRRWL